eukprot:gene4287-biopygen13020
MHTELREILCEGWYGMKESPASGIGMPAKCNNGAMPKVRSHTCDAKRLANPLLGGCARMQGGRMQRVTAHSCSVLRRIAPAFHGAQLQRVAARTGIGAAGHTASRSSVRVGAGPHERRDRLRNVALPADLRRGAPVRVEGGLLADHPRQLRVLLEQLVGQGPVVHHHRPHVGAEE